MSSDQPLNEIISFEQPEQTEETDFDLCYYTYYGKITTIIEQFNQQPIEQSENCVQESISTDCNRNALQIAAFLNFSNIFLYLLTFKAKQNYQDLNKQSTWHILAYRGHKNLLGILFNFNRYSLKMEILKEIDNIKKNSGFSGLDIVKGKLSKAVPLNDTNISRFEKLQQKIKNVAIKMIETFLQNLKKSLSMKDYQSQTPLHLAALSKFSLCHSFIYYIIDFNFFKLDESWTYFVKLFLELQTIETKKERMNIDPRQSARLEKELIHILGDNIILELSEKFNEMKKQLISDLINIQDKKGNNILHISSSHGDFKIVGRLIFNGANTKQKNKNNKLPVDVAKDNFVRKVLTDLNKAAKKQDKESIKELIDFGEDINNKITIFEQAPIHKLIESNKNNKHELLQQFFDEYTCDPNIKDSNGWTPLHYACKYKDFKSVQILIKNNAYVNSYSNNKRIPLHFAANEGSKEIVEFLLNCNADKDNQDELGCTPSHLAAKKGNVKCLEILLKYGASLYILDIRGWNVLHYACFHGKKNVISFLSKYDADYDILKNGRNSQNKLPKDILRDQNLKCYLFSIFHHAKEGNLDMTKNLLKEGQNVNEQTQYLKNTALHLAVLNAHYLEVKLLIKNGADPLLENFMGIKAKDLIEAMEIGIEMAETDENDCIDLRDVIRCLNIFDDNTIDLSVCPKNYELSYDFVFENIQKIKNLLGEVTKNSEDKAKQENEANQNKNEELKQ